MRLLDELEPQQEQFDPAKHRMIPCICKVAAKSTVVSFIVRGGTLIEYVACSKCERTWRRFEH